MMVVASLITLSGSSSPAITPQHYSVLKYFCNRWPRSDIHFIFRGEESDWSNVAANTFLACGFRLVSFQPCVRVLQNNNSSNLLYASYKSGVTIYLLSGSWGEDEGVPAGLRLNDGIWVLPRSYALNLDFGKLRLDSHVFYYEADPFHILISEIYSIKSQHLVTRVISTAPIDNAQFHSEIPIWERRSNLTGIHLRGVSKNHRQYSQLQMWNETHAKSASGMFPNVMEILQSRMGFQITYKPPTDGKWGAYRVS